jgi:hypothetical protein
MSNLTGRMLSFLSIAMLTTVSAIADDPETPPAPVIPVQATERVSDQGTTPPAPVVTADDTATTYDGGVQRAFVEESVSEPAPAPAITPAPAPVPTPALAPAPAAEPITTVRIQDTPSVEQPASFYQLFDAMKQADNGKKDRWLDYSGWVDFGYTFAFNSPLSQSNLPIGFNDQADEFQMNQFYMILETPDRKRNKKGWALDGRVDLLYGTDHFYTTARGLETRLDGSPHWNSVDPTNVKRLNATGAAPYYGLAMPQAYVDLQTPISSGMKIRMGHFYSPLGHESVMAKENFFYSHTYSRLYAKPFTHTGLLASTNIINDGMRISGGFTRGWDNFEDADNDLSILGGFAFDLEGHSFSVNVHTGDDHRYVDDDGNPMAGNVTVTTAKYSRKLGERGTYILQADLGYGEGMETHDTTGTLSEARWYGITNYLIYDYGDKVSGGLRVEWFRDQDNARVLGIAVDEEVNGGNYVGITGGVHVRPNDRWVLRSELRWDWSDVTSDVFNVNGIFNGQTKRDQWTMTADLIYSF